MALMMKGLDDLIVQIIILLFLSFCSDKLQKESEKTCLE
jgi:hypothetical protein